MRNQPGKPEKQWVLLSLLQWATSYFKSHHVESPRASAEILLAHALDIRRIDLYLQYDRPMAKPELDRFKVLIKRRAAFEPVAYIVGSKEFWSMDIRVTGDVLIPRPETKCLVEQVTAYLRQITGSEPKQILDLGTGSGAIVLALAANCREHLYFASDHRQKVLNVAHGNAVSHLLGEKVIFFAANWLEPLNPEGPLFDVIVSNPPYIRTDEIKTLQPEIVQYEPVSALDGGTDGLSCIRRIIGGAHRYLKSGGCLFLEIGHDQGGDVQRLVEACGRYESVDVFKDYSGYDRVVRAVKAG